MSKLKFSTKKLLQLLVLKIVSIDPSPGASIRDTLREAGLDIPAGTLYSLLSELRRKGIITYRLEELDIGPINKCYSLTKIGDRLLQILQKDWANLTRIVKALSLDPT